MPTQLKPGLFIHSISTFQKSFIHKTLRELSQTPRPQPTTIQQPVHKEDSGSDFCEDSLFNTIPPHGPSHTIRHNSHHNQHMSLDLSTRYANRNAPLLRQFKVGGKSDEAVVTVGYDQGSASTCASNVLWERLDKLAQIVFLLTPNHPMASHLQIDLDDLLASLASNIISLVEDNARLRESALQQNSELSTLRTQVDSLQNSLSAQVKNLENTIRAELNAPRPLPTLRIQSPCLHPLDSQFVPRYSNVSRGTLPSHKHKSSRSPMRTTHSPRTLDPQTRYQHFMADLDQLLSLRLSPPSDRRHN